MLQFRHGYRRLPIFLAFAICLAVGTGRAHETGFENGPVKNTYLIPQCNHVIYLDGDGNLTYTPPPGVEPLEDEHAHGYGQPEAAAVYETRGGGIALDLVQTEYAPGFTPSSITINAPGSTFVIQNNDGAGEGFNDPTPVAPVGGNPGVTLGQQRLNCFAQAGQIWGQILSSTIPIVVAAQFNPLTCNANGAILGSAGTITIHGNHPGRLFDNTWHHAALANAQSGIDINTGTAEINAQFNSSIDNNDACLAGTNWYYGFDGNAGGNIDLLGVLLHEFAHGLGVSTFVNTATGVKQSGFDDVYMIFLEDHSLGLTWPNMTDGQRMASAIDTGDLHWIGANVLSISDRLYNGTVGTHVRMNAPNPLVGGSSVSHFDTALTPNELMEPSRTVFSELFFTVEMFRDQGWPLFNPPTVPCALNLREDFRNVPAEIFPGNSGWFIQNNSSPLGTTTWAQGGSFPAHSGSSNSQIFANFNSGAGVATISNWLFTPPFDLRNGDQVRFFTRTASPVSFPDRLQVRLSTNGTSTNVGGTAVSVGDFTTLLLDINPTYTLGGYPVTYTQFTINLSGLPAGATTGRIAFRYFVENGGPSGARSNQIAIDTFEYLPNCTTPAPTATPNPSPSPNPSPTPAPCCPGDADNSGSFVDATDFISVQANFGADNGVGGLGDADCSGSFVDASDFIAVQANFGADCG